MLESLVTEAGRVAILSDWGVLTVAGADAAQLLEGQLSCSIEQLHANDWSFMSICNIKGRVLVSGYVIYFADTYYLLMPSNMLYKTQQVLAKYAVFFQVNLQIVPAILLGGIGVEQWHDVPFAWERTSLSVVACNGGFACTLSAQPVSRVLWVLLEQQSEYAVQSDPNALCAWHMQDIKQGRIFIDERNSEYWIPVDLGYIELGAVSLDKGCYIGQEIIARMHYRGQSKKSLHRFTTSKNPDLDIETLLYADSDEAKLQKNSIGQVLALAHQVEESDVISVHGLAMVQRSVTHVWFAWSRQELEMTPVTYAIT